MTISLSFHSSSLVALPVKALPRQRNFRSLTSIELLVVIGIVSILLALGALAVGSIKRAAGVTQAADEISGPLDTARAYAIAQLPATIQWTRSLEQ
jgi:Tfp pilus assembly protein FimT